MKSFFHGLGKGQERALEVVESNRAELRQLPSEALKTLVSLNDVLDHREDLANLPHDLQVLIIRLNAILSRVLSFTEVLHSVLISVSPSPNDLLLKITTMIATLMFLLFAYVAYHCSASGVLRMSVEVVLMAVGSRTFWMYRTLLVGESLDVGVTWLLHYLVLNYPAVVAFIPDAFLRDQSSVPVTRTCSTESVAAGALVHGGSAQNERTPRAVPLRGAPPTSRSSSTSPSPLSTTPSRARSTSPERLRRRVPTGTTGRPNAPAKSNAVLLSSPASQVIFLRPSGPTRAAPPSPRQRVLEPAVANSATAGVRVAHGAAGGTAVHSAGVSGGVFVPASQSAISATSTPNRAPSLSSTTASTAPPSSAALASQPLVAPAAAQQLAVGAPGRLDSNGARSIAPTAAPLAAPHTLPTSAVAASLPSAARNVAVLVSDGTVAGANVVVSKRAPSAATPPANSPVKAPQAGRSSPAAASVPATATMSRTAAAPDQAARNPGRPPAAADAYLNTRAAPATSQQSAGKRTPGPVQAGRLPVPEDTPPVPSQEPRVRGRQPMAPSPRVSPHKAAAVAAERAGAIEKDEVGVTGTLPHTAANVLMYGPNAVC